MNRFYQIRITRVAGEMMAWTGAALFVMGCSALTPAALCASGKSTVPRSDVFTDFREEKPGAVHKIEDEQFPRAYRGDVFAAEHGAWNKAARTGYEVVRVPVKNGRATGEYQDFLTGFITSHGDVWGRPVGVAVAQDGSLMVTDDGTDSVWRVSYAGKSR